MKQQENNFSYINILNLGIHVANLKNLNKEYWLKEVYKFKKENPTSQTRSIRGGWQSNKFLQTNPLFFSLCDLIIDTHKTLNPNPNIILKSLWINILSFTNFNTLHTHGENGDSHYSGVIYLKVPPNSGNIVFNNPLSISQNYPITPLEGDIFFFPSFLPHYVEPNLSQEDRISISFNFN